MALFPKEFVHDKFSRKYIYEDGEFPSISNFISNIPKATFTPPTPSALTTLPTPNKVTPPSTSKATLYKAKSISPKKKIRLSEIPKSDRQLRERYPHYQPYEKKTSRLK